MKLLWHLYITLAKVGILTFGGGYAMLPILQRELCEKRGWTTAEELMDYYAIGQCTPGIIAVNTATFVGNKQKGLLGGIAATFGIITPSLLVITLVAAFLQSFAHLKVVADAFAGIRVCVCVLIFNSVLKLFKNSAVDRATTLIFAVVLLLSAFTNLSPIIFILLSAGAGIVIKSLGVSKA